MTTTHNLHVDGNSDPVPCTSATGVPLRIAGCSGAGFEPA